MTRATATANSSSAQAGSAESTFDVAIVGAGFAGSLLARILAQHGMRVILLDRDHHPRFALGESTTPLANLALERLACRHGFEDLWSLAAWGRCRRERPELRVGRKRGFTFYVHEPGRPWRPGPQDERRLLVAASPSDELSDTHWLRADIDADFLERAGAAGAAVVQGVEVGRIARITDGWSIEFEPHNSKRSQERRRVHAGFVVDATGTGRVLGRSLDLCDESSAIGFSTRLVFSHWCDVAPFTDVCRSRSGEADNDRTLREPYPETWAAVHHITGSGYMYQLRFDDGTVSAGHLEIDRTTTHSSAGSHSPSDAFSAVPDPEVAWKRALEPHPLLQEQFAQSRAARPIEATGRLQRRLSAAAGPGWALLPHTYAFFDPLFSTGIAWSLLGVERLSEVLLSSSVRVDSASSAYMAPESESCPDRDAGCARYGRLLALEADHLENLIGTALAAMPDAVGLFAAARLYFVAASWEETRQRLFDTPSSAPALTSGARPSDFAGAGWHWQPFLGAGDPAVVAALGGLRRATHSEHAAAIRKQALAELECRDVAGILDPKRGQLHEVDLETVVGAAPRLGLSPAEARVLLPRLTSSDSFPGAAP